jgi:Ca2+-binding EF-hand superfamily protein
MTQQTLLSIRQQLAQRGTHGFRSFVVALDKVDFNKIRSIDKEQWKSALASVGVKLSGPEIESVFSAYNINGGMPYDMVLAQIKGGLSSRQEIIIDRVFEQLDVNGTGEIEMSDIRRKFNASLHPDVSHGGKNTNQVNEEFYYVWEYVRGLHDGPVTLEQWRAVYSDIACSVSSEDVFVEALCSVWGVVELGASNNVLLTIINQCRAFCSEKGVRSKEFFRDFDKLNTGLITEAQFLRGLDHSSLPVNSAEIKHILEAYKCTKNRASMVKYEIFCNRVDGLEDTIHKFESDPRMTPEPIEPSPLTEKRRHLDAAAEQYISELLDYLRYMAKTQGWIFKTYFMDFDTHNIGKVTPQQFRRNFPVELNDDQFAFLELKYQDPIFGDINYRALHDDITEATNESGNLDYKDNPLAHRAAATDERESNEIELRLQNQLFQKRIRIKDFFHDFDRLRTGLCTAPQFKRALQTAFKNNLGAHELDVLARAYTDPNDSLGRVMHRSFVGNMNTVFNKAGLERRPRTPIERPHQWQLDEFGEDNLNLTPGERSEFSRIMDKICMQVSTKRMNLKPFFENFDANHMEEVSKEQFTRSLYTADINLEEEEQRVLRKAFANPLRKGMINYGMFWDDLKGRLPNVPSHIGAMPVYTCKTLAKDPDDPDPEDPTSKGGLLMTTIRSNVAPNPMRNRPDDIDFEGLIDKLRSHVLVKQLRVNEFFMDFDRLRSGYVSKAHFRSGLAIVGLTLTDAELGLLEAQYRHPTADDRVNWRAFTDDLNLVFNQKEMESAPTMDGNLRYVPGTESLNPMYVPTKVVTMRTVSDDEDARINGILEAFMCFLGHNRIISVYDYFQQFDKAGTTHGNTHIRSGKVTKHQFFRTLNQMKFIVPPEDQELLCKRYMDIGDKVNYILFAEDVQPDRVPKAKHTAIPGYEGSPPMSLCKPWESKLKPPGTPDVDIEGLLDMMRAHVVRERVRTYDSMHVHDRHNTGKIVPIKFHGVLDQLGFVLSRKESKVLADHFTAAGDTQIDYRNFVDAMESSFTQKGLEKEPTVKVKNFQPMMPSDEVQPLSNMDDETFTDEFMSAVAVDFSLRRIQPKTFFQQYDKCKIGSVTAAQFKAVMKSLDCPLTNEEFEMINKRYHKGDRRICGDIGYVKFCRDLIAMVENPPVETSFGPGTDGPR